MALRKDILHRMNWLSHSLWGLGALVLFGFMLLVMPVSYLRRGMNIYADFWESEWAPALWFSAMSLLTLLISFAVFCHRAIEEYKKLLSRGEFYAKPRTSRGDSTDRKAQLSLDLTMKALDARRERDDIRTRQWKVHGSNVRTPSNDGWAVFGRGGREIDRRLKPYALCALLLVIFVPFLIHGDFAGALITAGILLALGAFAFFGVRFMSNAVVPPGKVAGEAMNSVLKRTDAIATKPEDKRRAAEATAELLMEVMLQEFAHKPDTDYVVRASIELTRGQLSPSDVTKLLERTASSDKSTPMTELLRRIDRGYDLIPKQRVFKTCVEILALDGEIPESQGALLSKIAKGLSIDGVTSRLLQNKALTEYLRQHG